MKQFNRNTAKFGIIELFNILGRKEGYSFKDEKSSREFINKLKREFHEVKNSQTTLHGIHTQEMFGHLINSLGKSAIVKQEDSGEIFTIDKSLKIPDFRLLLKDGQQLLVEVKNYYQSKSKLMAPYNLKRDYLNGLRQYANLFGCDLKIAIYWAKWNMWTLVSDSNIKDNGILYSLSMQEAMTANEMYILGDKLLGTKPPLKIRILIDKNTLYLNHNGKAKYKINNVEVYCDDIRIDDIFEKKLAYYLMLFGQWPLHGPIYDTSNKNFIISEFIFQPDKKNSENKFETIGFLSSLYSTYYNMVTMTESGGVERISPKQPLSLALNIPPDYKGKYLPLWQFVIDESKHV